MNIAKHANVKVFFMEFHDPARVDSVRVILAPLIRAVFSPGFFHRDSRYDACSDRKSTRLNSSHGYISYAVFCLKKKKRKRYSSLDSDLAHLDRVHVPNL